MSDDELFPINAASPKYREGKDNTTINLIFGFASFFFAFIVVFYTIFGTNSKIEFNFDFILLIFVIVINLLGYVLVLLPMIPRKIPDYFKFLTVLNSWLVVPAILLFSLILIDFMPSLKEANNSTDMIIILKYLLYILVPLVLVTFSRLDSLEKIFDNKLIDLGVFLFILFWTWWGIEFTNDLSIFPNLIKGFGYMLNLLAISTLAWSFFVIEDYQITRSFSKLFTVANFKVILSWFVVLMIIIVPIGLVVSFLTFNPGHLINMGLLGAILYLILAVIGVFLVQGIGEELLFRAFFYSTLLNKIKGLSEEIRGYVMIFLFFFVAGLIALTPYVGLANNINTGIVNSSVIPIKIIYPVIAILYFAIGIAFMIKTKDITYTMVLWSSMLFGWAHFEDWRYLLFATVAGIGYCETYRRTNNLFAASVIHMLVDVTWGAILTG